MDPVQKKRILIKFLKGISTDPRLDIAEERLTNYTKLDEVFDFLEINAVGLLEFTTIDSDKKKWSLLRDIILSNCKFTPANPPVLKSVSEKGLHERIVFWRNDEILSTLPQNDFYSRTTQQKENEPLGELIIACRLALQPVIESFLKEGELVDFTNHKKIQEIINQWNQKLDSYNKGSEPYNLIYNQLTILQDLNKINQLQVIAIPMEPKGSTDYCSLAESAGDVTEKIALITLAKAEAQLTNLGNTQLTSLEDYTANRSNYKLNTEVVLKLPKYGDIKEIQRESMALNISRLLGLGSTQASIMTHNGQPALFVPFDNIRLMKDFATDAKGSYNQNKVMLNDSLLFIVDKLIMSRGKLGLDSRMRELVMQYPSRIIHFHQLRISKLEKKLTQNVSDIERKKTICELKNLLILRDDADLLRTTIGQRIANIDTIFPQHDSKISSTEIRSVIGCNN